MSHGDLAAEPRTVGVIGAGTMGIGVVRDLVLQGLSASIVGLTGRRDLGIIGS